MRLNWVMDFTYETCGVIPARLNVIEERVVRLKEATKSMGFLEPRNSRMSTSTFRSWVCCPDARFVFRNIRPMALWFFDDEQTLQIKGLND